MSQEMLGNANSWTLYTFIAGEFQTCLSFSTGFTESLLALIWKINEGKQSFNQEVNWNYVVFGGGNKSTKSGA